MADEVIYAEDAFTDIRDAGRSLIGRIKTIGDPRKKRKAVRAAERLSAIRRNLKTAKDNSKRLEKAVKRDAKDFPRDLKYIKSDISRGMSVSLRELEYTGRQNKFSPLDPQNRVLDKKGGKFEIAIPNAFKFSNEGGNPNGLEIMEDIERLLGPRIYDYVTILEVSKKAGKEGKVEVSSMGRDMGEFDLEDAKDEVVRAIRENASEYIADYYDFDIVYEYYVAKTASLIAQYTLKYADIVNEGIEDINESKDVLGKGLAELDWEDTVGRLNKNNALLVREVSKIARGKDLTVFSREGGTELSFLFPLGSDKFIALNGMRDGEDVRLFKGVYIVTLDGDGFIGKIPRKNDPNVVQYMESPNLSELSRYADFINKEEGTYVPTLSDRAAQFGKAVLDKFRQGKEKVKRGLTRKNLISTLSEVDGDRIDQLGRVMEMYMDKAGRTVRELERSAERQKAVIKNPR